MKKLLEFFGNVFTCPSERGGLGFIEPRAVIHIDARKRGDLASNDGVLARGRVVAALDDDDGMSRLAWRAGGTNVHFVC